MANDSNASILEWEYAPCEVKWFAKSLMKDALPTHRTPIWRIWVGPRGFFSVGGSSQALITHPLVRPVAQDWTTLADAKRWCGGKERELREEAKREDEKQAARAVGITPFNTRREYVARICPYCRGVLGIEPVKP